MSSEQPPAGAQATAERTDRETTYPPALSAPAARGIPAGKVLLINESAVVLRALCAAQGTRHEQLQTELALVRQGGLAMDSESADPQLQVIVTPVHDDLGGVVASLALNVSHLPSVPPEWQDALKASAQRVSSLLGWQHAATA